MKNTISLFVNNENKEQAYKMEKYMKNKFRFLGLDSKTRRELQKEFLKKVSKELDINKVMVLQLWSYKEREFQYFALDYLIKCKSKLKKEDINLLETLILTKPWWDTVDLISSHLVGEVLLKYPDIIEEYIKKWSISDSIWLRRSAILYQLKYKEKTDINLLSEVINLNIKHDSFFIKKAIGWALREYSKTDGVWVRQYIFNHQISNLSRKEGMKFLEKKEK